MSAKKFTFKAPASVPPRPHLSVASVPSVQVSQGSSSSTTPSPSGSLAKPMEDLWLDDIDEDMLVQASQMAELQPGTQDRMEIDSDALNNFIKEESKSGDVWTSHDQSQRNIQQTQTVFQNRSTFSSGEPIKKSQSTPFRQPMAPHSTSSNDNKNNGGESSEKFKAEIKSFNQKLQAKTGEITFLRKTLNEKQKDIQTCHNERERMKKERNDDLKKFEAEKKRQEAQAKTNEEFLKRELEQAAETLEKYKRLHSHNNISDANGDCNGTFALAVTSPPPSKRQKLLRNATAAPANIDESLFTNNFPKKSPNHGGQVVPSKPKTSTNDASLQTTSRRRRANVLDQKEERLSFGSLMETGDGNRMIQSLHDTMNNQLTSLLAEIRRLSSNLQNCDISKATGLVEAIAKPIEFDNAVLLIDHLPLGVEVNCDQIGFPNIMLDELFSALLFLIDNDQRLHAHGLAGSIVNLVNAIVQNESLQVLVDLENLRKSLIAVIEKSKSLLSSSEKSCIVALNIVVGFMDLLAIETNYTKGLFCHHIKDVPDLTASLWSFIQCAKFYVDLPLGHEENLKLLAESLTRLMWQTTSLWSVCEACLEAVVKSSVTVMSAVVAHLADNGGHEQLPSILLQVSKSLLICFHHIWEFDEKSFVKAISANPKIQRRYVWSINHLLNLTENKQIQLEYDFLIKDLDFDRD